MPFSPPKAVRRRASDFSNAQIAVLSLVLTLLASIPVWTHPLPPLSDYINHLARMHVIASMGSDQNLSRYYQVDWQIIPNLMMDLIVPTLGRFVNIYLAGQIFTVSSFALIISGALALNRSLFGRWSVLPLVTMPLLYNYVFLVGLMNYIFGIGLALWALAAWIALRERPWPARYAVSSAFVIALFFCHLFALGIYGIGLLAAELWRLWLTRERPLAARLLTFFASGLPFLLALPLLVGSPTLKLATQSEWEPRGKIDGLAFVIEDYSDIAAFAITGIIVVACVWAVRHRLLRMHPLGWVLLAVSTVVYLAMPRVLFASYMADQRLPIAIAYMTLGCVDLKIHNRLVRRGFIAVLLTLLAVRLIEVDVYWSDMSATTKEFKSSVKRIKPGSKVLVAYADDTSGADVSDLALVHAACIAMIERSALVTTAFTVVGKQILHARPEYAPFVDTEDGTPPSIGQLVRDVDQPVEEGAGAIYWHMWPSRFDYLYVLFSGDEAPNPDPRHLTLVHDGDKFQLYRIKASP